MTEGNLCLFFDSPVSNSAFVLVPPFMECTAWFLLNTICDMDIEFAIFF